MFGTLKMKYYLFVCFVSFMALSSFALPTQQKDSSLNCADPTIACQDLQSAHTCGTVKSCANDVWANMHVPSGNDEICDICKEMVKEARDQLLSNMTQEEIKEVFEGSCKLLPVKFIAEGCIKIVDEIIPELVEMLASRMDPNMVCTVSGMCFPSNNAVENVVWKILNLLLIKNNNEQCTECTTMMTDVQTFLKSESESDIKAQVEKFCDIKMPSYLCKIVANEYFHEIYSYILSATPSQLCSAAGVCPQKCELKNEESKVKDDLTCEFCEHILEHIKDLVTTNTTMDEFKNALLNFCKATGKFADKCTAVVNDYYDMLFSYIKNLDTKGMCTLMGVCNSGKCTETPLVKLIPAMEVRRRVPQIKLQPAKAVESNDIDSSPIVHLIPANVFSKKALKESNAVFLPQLPIERFIHPLIGFERDTECALCKAFSFYLETDLAGDRSKDGVRKAIDGICDKWMKDYPTHCHHIVNNYSYKIQVALAKGAAFGELCSGVKVCPLEEDKTKELKVKVLQNIEGTPFCDLCKDAMNEVEKQLNDPATKQKLEALFGQVCNVLPKSLKDDCVSFINQNINAVLDILQQELKPDNICPALGLCSSSRVGVSLRVKDLECNVCKDVVTSFREKLQDPASKVIVETFLEEGCAQLPDAVGQECKKFVVENIDYLMKIIVEEMDPQKVCSILNICPASLYLLVEEPKVKDVECDLCKEVVGKIEDMVKEKGTEDEIKAALDKVCSYMPSSVSTKCQNFIDKYSDLIITLLAQELEPGMVCAELKLCQESMNKVAAVPLETSKLTDIECDLCKEVVGKLEDMVKDKKTEEEIKAALDKVCSYMPSSIATKCQTFINQYTDLIVTLLMEELDPDMVCAALKLCPESTRRVAAVSLETSNLKDLECDLCKQVVGKLEDMLKDKKTEEEIKAALDKVCSYMPSSIAAKCTHFIDQYTDLLVTLLAQDLDPVMVCAALSVCPEKARFAEWHSKAKDLECQGCQYALHLLQQQLMNVQTQDKLKEAFKKACALLPQTYADNCEGFVDEYGSPLLVLVAQEINPSQLCFQVKLCSNVTCIFEKKEDVSEVRLDECSICTTVVDYLDKLIEEDDVDKEITQLAERVCTVLPSSLLKECTSVLDTYGPYILQMIGQMADSKQICQDIDLCARSPEHVHLIGGSKCTFGPSYWCRSQAHAASCKAESFCKDKVWKN